MLEEMQEEEVAKFHKPGVQEVNKIVPAIWQGATTSKPSVVGMEASNDVSGPPQLELKTSLSLDPDKGLELLITNTLNPANY
jgi:hypothetical protein